MAQELEAEVPADDRRAPEHLSGFGIEAIQPCLQDGLDGVGNGQTIERRGQASLATLDHDGSGLQECVAELLDEERVASRLFPDALRQLHRHARTAERGPHDLQRGFRGQGCEVQVDLSPQRGALRAQFRPGRYHQKQGIRRNHLGQLAQDVTGAPVGPMPVLEEQHQRLAP